MGNRTRHSLRIVAAITFAILAACSAAARRPTTFADLDAAARGHLTTLSSGRVGGNAALAASLSAGEVAIRDDAGARAAQAQEAAGNTTDFGFDVISVASHPLDGGTADFIAFEKIRFRSDGVAANLIEIYHRDDRAALWKSVFRCVLAANIDLPTLQVDAHGSGHVLAIADLQARHATPDELGARYAAAVSAKSRLPDGTFAAGEFTSGEVTYATNFLSSVSDHGSGSLRWENRPGGTAVALTDGVLVFATLQREQSLHKFADGATRYFVVQDPKRVNYSGLIPPGQYSGLTLVSSVTVAIVVRPTALPDAVGRDGEVTSVQIQRL